MPAGGARALKFGLVLRGTEGLRRALSAGGEVENRARKAATRAMIENTEDLLGRAQRNCPRDEGTLMGSGHAAVYVDGRQVSFSQSGGKGNPPVRLVVEGGGRDAIVGEVGFNMPYAAAQHEGLNFEHPKSPDIPEHDPKPKYLESNLKTQADRYQQNMADRLGEALR